MRKMYRRGLLLAGWMLFWSLFSGLFPAYVMAAEKTEQEKKEVAQNGQDFAGDLLLDILIQMFSEEEQPWVDTGTTPPDEQHQQLQALQNLFGQPENIPAAAVENNQNLASGTDDASYIYQTGQSIGNNPELVGLQQPGIIENDQALALVHGAYDADSNSTLNEILTGCTTTTTTEEGETREYFNSDVQYCRQARNLETGQCQAEREVNFVPVDAKTIIQIDVVKINQTESETCPGDEDYDMCMIDAANEYGACIKDSGLCDPFQPDQSVYCEECRLRQEIMEWSCRRHCQNPGLTGVFTMTGESIGEPVLEQNLTLLNGEVNVRRTPFHIAQIDDKEPGTYFVGSYVLGVENGNGNVTEVSIGTAENFWDYDLRVDLEDAVGITISAVLYKVELNTFAGVGCDASMVNSLADGMCDGTAVCTNEPQCMNVDGVDVCGDGATSGVAEILQDWGVADLNNMCWQADLDISKCVTSYSCEDEGGCSCEGLTGDEHTQCIQNLCWIDVHGDLICPDTNSPRSDWTNNLGDVGWVDDCEEQLANDKCVLTEIKNCDPDQTGGATGECYERDVIFECGETVEYTTTHGGVSDSTSCNAVIDCIGDDCVSTEEENNEDFQEAMLAASVVNSAQGETECADPTNPETCRIFVGTDEWCKEPRGHHDDIGIIPNCCEMAEEMAAQFSDLSLYLRLIRVGNSMELWETAGGAIAETGVGQAVGEWMEPVTEGFSSIMESFGIGGGESQSLFGSIFGTDVQGSAFSGVGQFVADMLYDALPEEMANSLFSSSGGSVTGWGTGQLGQVAQFISQALSVIMWIYMIYQFLKILANLIPGFKCEDEELQFGQKLVTRSCHYVGKKCAKYIRLGPFIKECVSDKRVFCCYESPLARIINEQIKGQSVPPDERASYTGPEWGTVDEPECGGLTLGEIKEIDWSTIDLSEWYAIMQEAGLIPDPDEYDAPVSWESSSVYMDDEAPEDYIWDNDVDQNIDILEDLIDDANNGQPRCNPLTGENCESPDTGDGSDGGGSDGGGSDGGGSDGGGSDGGGTPEDPICDPDNGEVDGCFEEPKCDPESGDFAGCIKPEPEP